MKLTIPAFIFMAASCERHDKNHTQAPNRESVPSHTEQSREISSFLSEKRDRTNSSPIVTSTEFLKKLKSAGALPSDSEIKELLSNWPAELRNDDKFVSDVANFISQNYTDNALLSVIKYWPEGSGRNELAPALIREISKNHGIDKAEKFYTNLPRISEIDVRIAMNAGTALSEIIVNADCIKGIEWVENISDKNERTAAIGGMSQAISLELENGRRGMLDSALSVVHSDEVADYLYSLGYTYLSETDMSGAIDWLLSINENRPIFADKLIVSKLPIPDAILYLNELYALGWDKRADPALQSFTGEYANKQSPQAALEWLAGVPPGSARDNAIRQASFMWSTQDISAAKKWAESFPDKSVTKPALEFLDSR